MNYEEIYERVDKIDGWMGSSDCETIYRYASLVKGTIVEIGAHMGRSTVLMALSSPESKVITIDPFKDTIFGPVSGEEVRKRFYENVEGLNITCIESTSKKAHRGWNKEIDLLLIDGDHLYEAVKTDIRLWAPHVKKGSYVLIHDYYFWPQEKPFEPQRHGVYKAVEELKDKYFDEVLVDEVNYGFAICRKK